MNRVVFVSYARVDRLAVEPAVDLLRAGGVEVFVDVLSIGFGERWNDVLNDALARCERVLVFWSRAAAASEWVDREWRSALAMGKKIVPTLLDRTPLPAELAEFHAVTRLLTDSAPAASAERSLRPLPAPSQPRPQPSAAPPAATAPRGARKPLVLAAAGLLGVAALVTGALWLPQGSEPPSVTLPAPGPPASGPIDGVFESMLVESGPLWLVLAVIVLLLITLGRRRARSRGASQTNNTRTLRSDGPLRPSPSWAAGFIDDVFSA
jgi:hypothetical protein